MAEGLEGAGKSSYSLVEQDRLFATLSLRPGSTFLDLACGRGEYSLRAAREIGPAGRVYGIDLWEEAEPGSD